MAQLKDTSDHVFNPGKAQWLREEGAQELDDNQQALLLALAQLEAELGRELSEEERTALETLSSQMHGFSPENIVEAVHKMVQQPADPARKTVWPELKRHK